MNSSIVDCNGNQDLLIVDHTLLYRSKVDFDKDKKNLQALLQMALEVELFTIPLYMSSMYSIYGYHQINTGNNFYEGRQWPGLAPKFSKNLASDPNQNAFNKVFKVFIEEMLHLQIAANLCNAYDQAPRFTNNSLVNEDFSWKCYGNENTVIPGIIDFKDLKEKSEYKNTKVRLDSLNKEQIKLFLAIESAECNLQNEINKDCLSLYKHSIPLSEENEEKLKNNNLLFGSISGLYTAIILYLLIQYEDGERLFQKAFSENEKLIQRERFNKSQDSGRESEYPHFLTNLNGITKTTVKFSNILGMINGILDQGEGLPLIDLILDLIFKLLASEGWKSVSTWETVLFILNNLNDLQRNKFNEKVKNLEDSALKTMILEKLQALLPNTDQLLKLEPEHEVDIDALEENHPSYDDKGNKIESASKAARGGENGKKEHLEIFREVQELIDQNNFQTWDQYHENKNVWDAEDLIKNFEDYQINLRNYPQLATAEEIAKAMNEVTSNKTDIAWITLLSQANTGTLKGLLNGMQKYWTKIEGEFPGPAMGGSGDRMSICWALLGSSPNLAIPPLKKNEEHIHDYHACQGLYLPKCKESELDGEHEPQNSQSKCGPSTPEGSCGAPKLEGGCGIPELKCGSSKLEDDCGTQGKYYDWIRNGALGCASPAVYHSCKGSNSCKSEGGCGFVQAYEGGTSCGSTASNNPYSDPIYVSAPGANNCAGKGGCAVPISALQMFPSNHEGDQMMKYKSIDTSEVMVNFSRGELVYDVAWKVYKERYKQKFDRIPKKPKANILRLIFPPST